jgi:ABC-2 type transport system ATP-binding protein
MTELALAIETNGLRKAFGSKVAVSDLTLSVRQGEVFGFLGPNGAGKTTSIKMLLGLVRPSAGEGCVLGQPLGHMQARAKVGFLPEHFRFQDWLTGREFLRFHGRLYGMAGAALRDRIEVLLKRVDLLDAGDREIRGYSKGMLQRIGLAQALLNHPQLVFLDEPTSGLDPLGRLLVRDILHELRAEGTAVFLNSHLLSEVEAVCDRVVFIRRGFVVREINLREHDLAGVEVTLRLGEISPDVLHGLAQFGSVISHHAARRTCTLLINREEDLPALARWLIAQGAALYEMNAHVPSLESVFLETMGESERPG